jgi:hypothetical protein
LALKGNHRALHADVSLLLKDPRWERGEKHSTANGDHGRIETRTSSVCTEVAGIQKRHRWPGLAAIGKVIRTRDTAGTATTETAYYLPSAALSPERLAQVARSHRVSKTGFTGFSTPSCTRTGREIATITAHTISRSCTTWQLTLCNGIARGCHCAANSTSPLGRASSWSSCFPPFEKRHKCKNVD